jgi:transposase InsO family protein
MNYLNYLKTETFKNHPLKNEIPVSITKLKRKNWFLNYYDYSKLDKWSVLRDTAKSYDSKVQIRLEWMIFYEEISGQNALNTSSHFGISPKTFHKWHKRFIKSKMNVEYLKDQSKSPLNKRKPVINTLEESRIFNLRRKHMRYGRKKLQKLYITEYKETISLWKIERVIRKHRLYPDKVKHQKIVLKRTRGRKTSKTRIQNYLGTISEIKVGSLWHVDSIILHYIGFKRTIITAIDEVSRIGYARVYSTQSSKNAEDFLHRLNYLTEGTLSVMHSDNGSEFEGLFKRGCQTKGIKQIYSRKRTPKDNAKNERFNRTIQEEWLEDADIDIEDINKANKSLTEWLIEYNTKRPHESLNYDTPVEYVEKMIDNESKSDSSNVLPMSSVSTRVCYSVSSKMETTG